MANAVVTVKIMPDTVDTDLGALEQAAVEKIVEFAGEGDTRSSVEPVAFGLKSLQIIFVMDENLGSPDAVAERIEQLDEVMSCEVTDVRRAIG